MQSDLYNALLDELKSKLTLPPDQPDETAQSTLAALWHAAAGDPCSAKAADRHTLEDLTETQQDGLRRMIAERCAGRPLMQITKRAHFMDLELEFGPDVCVVRPETEILGNNTVEILGGTQGPVMIEVGCGSGNLSCGISYKVPLLKVHAVDILQSCVDLTVRNVARYNLSNRVSIYKGDLFGPLENLGLENTIDAVICNPPYIASSRLKNDRAYLTAYEPREAFDGGPFGFGMYQRLIKESLRFLKPGGNLLFEFGAGQDKQVEGLIKRAGGYDGIEFKTDPAGVPRVVIVRKAG
jgi:HemK-like putative methylase